MFCFVKFSLDAFLVYLGRYMWLELQIGYRDHRVKKGRGFNCDILFCFDLSYVRVFTPYILSAANITRLIFWWLQMMLIERSH